MTAPLAAKRASLTQKERRDMLDAQGGVCAECGGPGPFDADHTDPVALGNGSKPDRLICRHRCHKAKTAKDKGDIAWVSHMRLLTGQQARRKRRAEEGRPSLIRSNPKIAKRLFQKPPPGYSPWPKKKVKP